MSSSRSSGVAGMEIYERAHWIAWPPRDLGLKPCVPVYDEDTMEGYRASGWRVEGPFVLQQPQGAVSADEQDDGTGHCPTCGQHHLAESDVAELHELLTKCEKERDALRDQLRGAVSVDERQAVLDCINLYGDETLHKALDAIDWPDAWTGKAEPPTRGRRR